MPAGKRLAVIDGKSVFYRGYYAMPNLSMRDGTPTGGVYGFAALSLQMLRQLKPDYVAVAWDKPKTNIRKRKEIYPDYKAGRKPAPPDFYFQIPLLNELLEAFHWPLYEYDDYEADDIMGALADKAAREDIEVCLITSDLDSLQLIGPKVHVYVLKKGFTDIDMFDPASFEAKYGIDVHQFLDLKALKGDSSDNIPGVPGVGEKTALQLLKDYQTLEGVYDHLDDIKPTLRKKLEAGRDSAFLSKKVAEIWLDVPVPLDLEAMDVTKVDTAKVVTLLNKFEFKSLLRNLPEHMKHQGEMPVATEQAELKQVRIEPFDDEAKVRLGMSDAVAVVRVGEQWLISPSDEVAFSADTATAATALARTAVIAHDAKPLLHELLQTGHAVLPTVAHDTRVGGFMINSLVRYKDLADMAGADLSDDSDGSKGIAALWSVYHQQQDAFTQLPQVAKLAREVDFALIPLLAEMEHRGIKLDCDFLGDMSKDLERRIGAVQQQIYEHAGYEFNTGSPSQLADVLYGKLQLSTAGAKRGKAGGYSTGIRELERLRGTHPIIELIEQYRELTKLKSTYVDALPKLVDAHGRLHTTFNQDVAATGRLSSTDPNLQNIPIRSEMGRKIRTAFVPKAGNVFVSADYSQFELRLAAVLAGDTQLIDDFNGDLDIHTKTASDVYGVPLDAVTKEQRRDAKVINFGVLYGMSPHGLSAATGMSFGEAKKFIDSYFQLRAPIRRYIDATLKQAEEQGYVETLFGRRRPTPDVKSSNFVVREAAKRAAANMPIQGTEADLMKMAMLQVEQKLQGRGVQVLQIHDSIMLECPVDKAGELANLLKETMENVYPELGVRLRVDVSSGRHWGEL